MDRIIAIAQQLSKEGKVPNTALIKARLPKNVPLPVIIQGLKIWKENPHKQVEMTAIAPSGSAAQHSNSGSLDTLLDAKIAQALTPLHAQIDKLQTELNNLQKQLNKKEKS